MLELILLVNLAFSMVGFFFIVRMYKEVKSRRDYYGENFGIPFGKDRSGGDGLFSKKQKQQPAQIDADTMAAILAAANAQNEQAKPVVADKPKALDGDLQKLLAAAGYVKDGA